MFLGGVGRDVFGAVFGECAVVLGSVLGGAFAMKFGRCHWMTALGGCLWGVLSLVVVSVLFA